MRSRSFGRIAFCLASVIWVGVPVAATAQTIEVSPTTVDFGEVRTGTQAELALSIVNTDTSPLSVTELSGIGEPFSLKDPPTLPVTVVPGGGTTLTVVFSPTTVGVASGDLYLTSNDPVRDTVTVGLSGIGIAPSLVVTPTQLDFPGQRRATTSDPLTVTLVNTGSDDLAVSSLLLEGTGAGTFSVTGLEAPAVLENGVPVTLEVRFTPDAADERTATLTIVSDDPELPQTVVTLSGNGRMPGLEVLPAEEHAFGSTLALKESAPVTFTLTNVDTEPLPLEAVRWASATEHFRLEAGGVAGDLAVGADVTFQVAFTPMASGELSGDLEVVLADDPTPVLSITVRGVGTDAGGGGGSCAVGGRAPSWGSYGLGALLVGLWTLGRRRRIRPERGRGRQRLRGHP